MEVSFSKKSFLCYDQIGDAMKRTGDNFDQVSTYKLYRNVYEIVHPTISKKNISNYRIVLKDDLMPLRIFYPNKVSNLTSIIIFVHGDGMVSNCFAKYSKICKEMAITLNQLVIALDYDEIGQGGLLDFYESCYRVIAYLYYELAKLQIDTNRISIMGDSTGASAVVALTRMACCRSEFVIGREILLYPAVSMEYFGKTQFSSIVKNGQTDLLTITHLAHYFQKGISNSEQKNILLFPLLKQDYSNFPDTLVVTGSVDPLCDEGRRYVECLKEFGVPCEFLEIEFAGHGFLQSEDLETKKEFYDKLLQFLS